MLRRHRLLIGVCHRANTGNLEITISLSLLLKMIKSKQGVPYVRLPNPRAIPPLRPFWLFDSSFESPWQLKLHCASLNLQIGVVVEI